MIKKVSQMDVRAILVEFNGIYNTKDKAFHFRIKDSCYKLRKSGYLLLYSTIALKCPSLKKRFIAN
jgi:hypothetical protein